MSETDLTGYGWNWKTLLGSQQCLESNRRDLHKLDFVLNLFTERRVAVQAGGNLGLFPKRLSSEFNAVYTFEPEPDNFRKLCANAPERNIIKFQTGLGAFMHYVSMGRFTRERNHEGVAHVSGAGDIPLIPLDMLELKRCDLVYLDLEGYEVEALRGARMTLWRCLPVVVAEFNTTAARYGHTLDQLFDVLKKSGNYVPVLKLWTDYVFIPYSRLSVKAVQEAARHMDHITGAECLL